MRNKLKDLSIILDMIDLKKCELRCLKESHHTHKMLFGENSNIYKEDNHKIIITEMVIERLKERFNKTSKNLLL